MLRLLLLLLITTIVTTATSTKIISSRFHVAHVLEIELFEFVHGPGVNVALIYLKLGVLSNLQVLEVYAQTFDGATVVKQRVERVKGEAHFGQIDARNRAAKALLHQVVGVVDRDETRGAPFGLFYVRQRELVPQLVLVREHIPATAHATTLAQVTLVQIGQDLEKQLVR
jgi:hypothetical protein